MPGESRGSGALLPPGRKSVGLPPRPFLYTLDQIAGLLDLAIETVMQSYVYYVGRSVGSQRKDLLIARNIAPAGEKPEWRVSERELVRWMRTKGFRHYERSTLV